MRWLYVVLTVGCGRIDFDLRADASDGSSDDASQSCVTAMQSSGDHSCALRADGVVLCKGFNSYGEIGDGTTNERADYIPVFANATALGTGEWSTCVARMDGVAACWGRNQFGQVGDGSTSERDLPTLVQGVSGVDEIRVGQYFTCARTGGTVSCWGDNVEGELGDGTQAPRPLPAAPVSGITTAKRIVVSDHVGCALLGDSQVHCWGQGGYVGDGTPNIRLQPVPVTFPRPVAHIEGGCHLHTCAILDDGSVYCWGEGVHGQLGDGTQNMQQAPVRAGTLTDVVELGLGAYHTCARTSTGDVYCWGENIDGQLDGQGGAVNPNPTLVPFVTNVDALAVGCRHTCARIGSEVWCWGEYGTGALATPTPIAKIPVPGC